MDLRGVPSDELPAVLAAGMPDVRFVFVSMSAREPSGRDAEYLEWHSLDHRVEQYRIGGLRHSLRVVSTPACRAARATADPSYDSVDHVMTYFFAGGAALDRFNALSAALTGERRPFRLPSVHSGYYSLAGKIASRSAVTGADVMPWRPTRGVYVILERGAESPAELAEVPGVAGIWWHAGSTAQMVGIPSTPGGTPPMADRQHSAGHTPPALGFPDNTGLQLSYCFLDDDPVETAKRVRPLLEQRWAAEKVAPLLAAPFYSIVPFEWQRYLP
jgi:hypothetical protein